MPAVDPEHGALRQLLLRRTIGDYAQRIGQVPSVAIKLLSQHELGFGVAR